jgi:hypothetical protein
VASIIDIEQPGRVPPLADRELRMSRAEGVPVASDWLRRHKDHGWDQTGEGPRTACARRLLFALHLMAEGKLSDD